MRAGIFQCAAGGLTPAERLERLAVILEDVDLDIVVCPELFMSGYNVGDKIPALAEPLDGPFSKSIGELARANKTAIVYGYPERAGDNIYNSALCLGPDGLVIANHRKLLLPPGFEARYFSGGKGPTLFQLRGVSCAILICYDAEFPEAVRAVVDAGAQIVLVPTALTDRWRSVAYQMMPTRAFENGVWVVYANHAGEENGTRYLGASCIISPDGTDKARAANGEELIGADLDIESIKLARAQLPYLTDAPRIKRRLDVLKTRRHHFQGLKTIQ
jgi:predicted amidohydrolase